MSFLGPDEQAFQAYTKFLEAVAEKPSLHEVLETANGRLSTLFDLARVSVVLFQDDDDVAFVVVESQKGPLQNIVIRLSDYPELQAVRERKAPVVVEDVFEDSLFSSVQDKLSMASEPPKAVLVFPLIREGKVLGAIFLRSPQVMGEVTETLLERGRVIALMTSIAIGHALSEDTLKSERRELQRSQAIAQKEIAGLKRYVDFFERSRDGILVVSPQGEVLYVNMTAREVFGIESGDIEGARMEDLFPEDCISYFREYLEKSQSTQTTSIPDYHDVQLGEGGNLKILSAACRRISDPESVLISLRDVSNVRKIEIELRQTSEFLEKLIQSSADAIVVADNQGEILIFNAAAAEILSYTADEVIGKMNIRKFYPDGQAEDVMRRMRSVAHGGPGRVRSIEKTLLAKSGETIPVELSASIIYDDGREEATVGIFVDRREQKELESRLQQVHEQLQLSEKQSIAVELAGTAAHELNQPLTSILGYADLLNRVAVTENEKVKKGIDIIAREAERMSKIVRKLGEITSYETKAYVGSSQIMSLGSENSEVSGLEKNDPEIT